MPKTIHLLLINPQNSFCKVVSPEQQQERHDGEFCVPGAWGDMERVAALVDRLGDGLYDVHVMLETRHWLHISHPMWFIDSFGNPPKPFTVMREEKGTIIGCQGDHRGKPYDVGEFSTASPALLRSTLEYLGQLEANRRYVHRIWPPHCIIGTPGHNMVIPVLEACRRWCQRNLAFIDVMRTGSNIFTEYHSAVQAAVPHLDDPTTELNTDLINMIMEADDILIAGEPACSVENTIIDIAAHAGDGPFLPKCVLLTDGTSTWPDFEQDHQGFVEEMVARGMRTSTCADYCD